MIQDFLEGLLNSGELVRDIKRLKPLPGMSFGAWLIWAMTMFSLAGIAISPVVAYLCGFPTFAAWVCSTTSVLCVGLVTGRRARRQFQSTETQSWDRAGW